MNKYLCVKLQQIEGFTVSMASIIKPLITNNTVIMTEVNHKAYKYNPENVETIESCVT